MKNENYSAGLVSQSFWFIEFKKMVILYSEEKTQDEIKKLCLEDNLFGTSSLNRSKQMYGYLNTRVKRLDNELVEIFIQSDIQTQKLINLISILRGDRLFFEFIFEVYREKVLFGTPDLGKNDINIFFTNKEIQSEKVSNFSEATKKRLSSAYFNFMIDANLLRVEGKNKLITPPIIDNNLEKYLKSKGENSMLKAITGVN